MGNEQPPTEQESTLVKPYLVRAIHMWAVDNGLTPHILVDATHPHTDVPSEHVEDGRMVLNIHPAATHALYMGNEALTFSTRFSGVPRNISIPVEAVLGIFARENGEGLSFAHNPSGGGHEHPHDPQDPDDNPPKGRPSLKVVK